MTFNGRFLLNLIRFAGVQGASTGHLLALSGLTEAELGREDQKVEAETFNKVMAAIQAETRDPYFGMHASEYLNLSAAGLVLQITQTSSTVKEALDYCCEFSLLSCQHVPLSLNKEKRAYRLSFIPDTIWANQSPQTARQIVEGMMAFALREFHTLTVQKHYPLAVHFRSSKPHDTSEYERVFCCPLLFDQAENALLLATEQVEEKIVTANYELLEVLVRHAREKLESHHQFYEQVKKVIVNLSHPELPSLKQVAANLNMSVRSLQRKLSDEGHSFKEIIEELRRSFAISYLKDPGLHVNDVAYMLNYSDASAFIRSFRRWTGHSPSRYRQAHLN
ncbi:MAG: hypothetical protein CMI36_14750 [Owenweeksia sp.]|nr:hypothetical protein [Owenweeksia sp.]MBG00250.1 hypothetical protein [Owenweeksia sp.]HBF19248.1 hypothetical protein [Cryomorphaceae bacterium]HCQ16415.1 hypothetical protein [Cryomorphaceae bacterium]|tara:strand:- start:1498 stop:2502 length:1005 start_codon:yes stop_codon:yes gene_type:complete